MRLKITFLFTSIACLLCASGLIASTEFDVSLSHKSAFVGDIVFYEISITSEKEILTVDGLSFQELKNFKVEELKDEYKKSNYKKKLVLIPLLEGIYTINEKNVSVQYIDGTSKIFQCDKFELKVATVGEKDEKWKDIRDITPILQKATDYRQLFFIALFILAAIFVSKYFIDRFLRKHAIETPLQQQIEIPAYEEASFSLDELLESDYIEKGQTVIFYTELGDIAKKYLERIINRSLTEKTTREVLTLLRENVDLPADINDDIRMFLTQCDSVKFAKEKPGVDDIQLNIKTVRTIMNRVEDYIQQVKEAEIQEAAAEKEVTEMPDDRPADFSDDDIKNSDNPDQKDSDDTF